jgi:beta-galactosidase
LGFVNFSMDQFGVQSPDLKRIARTPLLPASNAPSESDAQPVMQWLGADVKSVTTPGEISATGLGHAEGVFVIHVPPDSAAAKAGLHENDVILKLNATALTGLKDFIAAWQTAENGEPLHMEVWREQKRLGIDLTKAESPREHLSLDANWKFHLGDEWAGAMQFDKSGVVGGPASDTLPGEVKWRTVNLPHDWAIELPFDRSGDGNHGFKPLGPGFEKTSIGWYRREFQLPAQDSSKRIWLTFDGVFRDATVWVNGWLVRRHEGGYYPFREDITNVVRFGEKNVIAVRVDATKFEGWFYEGAGIYRHVWLEKTAPLAIAPDGIFVYSTFKNNVPADTAQVHVDATLLNTRPDAATAEVSCEIISPEGQSLSSFKAPATDAPGQSQTTIRASAEVASPVLWSPESPKLYKLVTRVRIGDKLIDQEETSFGIRTEAFDPTVGFLLNGKRYEIHGTCNHEDHAGVGTAVPDALQAFRVKKLKEFGCNAIRTAHNPPTPELLDACDHLGMLVMDESRTFGSDAENLRKWGEQICRDRDHPCVTIWSIGNEERLVEDTPQGAKVALAMQNCAKRLDPTRPVTYAAPEGNVFQGVNSVIEVRGWNYNYGPGMDAYHSEHPNQPNLGTEQASAVGTRGNYANDWAAGRIQAYDIVWPGWEATAESWWSYFADHPWLSGGFAWTGFDYRGEPSPCPWPCINSQFGILDTCGFPKDSFYYYQAWWTTRPVLHLAPHWNWPGKEGQEIRVEAQSNCREVELFLNGGSLGRKVMKPHSKLFWQVKYSPGILSAKGFDAAGALTAETQVQTTGAPARVQLTPDRKVINADGEDVAVFTMAALDSEGRVVPLAQNKIKLAVAGSGKIIGVGNGDPTCHEPDTYINADAAGWSRSLFNGLAQVIVQSTQEAGDIKLTAESEGLTPATGVVQTQQCALRPAVP